MPRYVALLRAINVGGHTVEMKRLAKLFEALGFDEVQTFIASGNVVFSAASGAPGALEKRIAAHLAKSLGYAVAAFLRTPAQLAAIVAHRAFAKPLAGSTLYIGFLGAKHDAAAARQVAALAAPGNEFALHDRTLYWRSTLGMGRNPISGAKLEKALGQPTTLRRDTTVGKLAAKFA
jgi:uncharacterized protein (DUF1697 family)